MLRCLYHLFFFSFNLSSDGGGGVECVHLFRPKTSFWKSTIYRWTEMNFIYIPFFFYGRGKHYNYTLMKTLPIGDKGKKIHQK